MIDNPLEIVTIYLKCIKDNPINNSGYFTQIYKSLWDNNSYFAPGHRLKDYYIQVVEYNGEYITLSEMREMKINEILND